MDNSRSKDIKDTIYNDGVIEDSIVGVDFFDELQSQVTAEIDQAIVKNLTRLTRLDKTDSFLKELFLVQEMLPLLKRTEKFLLENLSDETLYYEVYSDCGNFLVRYTKDYCIQFFMKYTSSTGYETLFQAAELHFQNINLGNFVNEDTFSFSPMNKGMKILGCTDYKLNDDLEHDEAWYFQKMTQVDLPPEEYFIAVQNVLKLLWEGQYVYISINMMNIFDEPHIDEYQKLVKKLEEQNVEHN